MGMPGSVHARLYYRAAFQRFREAEVLMGPAYHTGAMYLAGYAVECMLKALVLADAPEREQADVLKLFRGGKAHEFDWLRSLYLTRGGQPFPREVNRQFTLVSDWSTELRYSPRATRVAEAETFLRAALALVRWADGRL